MNVTMISFVVLLVVIAAGFYAVVLFNGLVYLRNQMDKGWANIDVLLKKRHDLVPNLVETVKGYATHERKTFEAVTTARSAAATVLPQGRGSAPAVAQAEQVLGGTLRSLMMIAEAYPELKANENFLSLQDTLVGVENQIAERREPLQQRHPTLARRIRCQIARLRARHLFQRRRRRPRTGVGAVRQRKCRVVRPPL